MSFVEAFTGGNDGGTNATSTTPNIVMAGGGTESVGDIPIDFWCQNSATNTLSSTSIGESIQSGPDVAGSNLSGYITSLTSGLTSGQITTGVINGTWSGGAKNLEGGVLLRGRAATGWIIGTPFISSTATSTVTLPSLTSVPASADIVGAIIVRSSTVTAVTATQTDLTNAGYTIGRAVATNYGVAPQFTIITFYKANVSSGNYGGETINLSAASANKLAYLIAIPAAGTAFTQSPSDAVGLTDQVVIEHGFGQVVSDSAGLTDTFSTIMDYSRSVTDTTGLTDSVVISQGHARNITDDTGITDQVVISKGFGQLPVDAVGITDQVIISLDRTLVIMDSVGITEPSTTESPSIIRPIDLMSISDTAILTILGGQLPGSIMDLINQDLITRGFTGPGTVLDRERQRLVAATGKDVGYTIDDLYEANGERNRVALESVAIIPDTA